jgi:leucyl-tRNA synthetase
MIEDSFRSLMINILNQMHEYAQERWLKENVFEVRPDFTSGSGQKAFISTPMPYTDSLLSLNRGYAMAMTDIVANYQSLKGKNVLLSVNFHFGGTKISV